MSCWRGTGGFGAELSAHAVEGCERVQVEGVDWVEVGVSVVVLQEAVGEGGRCVNVRRVEV